MLINEELLLKAHRNFLPLFQSVVPKFFKMDSQFQRFVVLDEKKSIIRMSKKKLNAMEDYEICLARYVLIRNTLKKVIFAENNCTSVNVFQKSSTLAESLRDVAQTQFTIFMDS